MRTILHIQERLSSLVKSRVNLPLGKSSQLLKDQGNSDQSPANPVITFYGPMKIQ